MNSRRQPRKWDSGSIQTRRKFSATRAPSTRTQKKQLEIGEMSIEILTRSESVKYLGQQISLHHQETTEIKNRIRAAWATFRKCRQELTPKNYMLNHRLRAIQRLNISDYMLRCKNMDTQLRTRKKDSIDATQDITTHHSNKKKIQKDREPRNWDQR